MEAEKAELETILMKLMYDTGNYYSSGNPVGHKQLRLMRQEARDRILDLYGLLVKDK